MMKQEFENMVGKEVSYETFKMYNDMYMACPDSVDKKAFVGMLNIEAIPERRERAEEFARGIKEQIAEYKKSVKMLEETIKDERELIKSCQDCENATMARMKKDALKYDLEQLEWNKRKVAELEFILA